MAIYTYIAPVRSISLPNSRIHPTSLKFQSTLTKLKSWESSSSPCSTSQTQPILGHDIETGLARLVELFDRVEQLLQSPLARNSLQHHHQEVEDALEGSVRLLDVCNMAKELIQAMKDHVNGLQSALRRRGNSSSIHENIQAYFTFRKKARKSVTTSLRLLSKKISHRDNNLVIQSTREASSVAASVFESLFMFLSSPNSRGSWAVMKSKLVRSGEPVLSFVNNEVGSVDAALCKYTKINDVKEVQRRLEVLDGCIQGIKAKLESVFRCLIKNRVSLLNLVTPF